MVKTIQEFLSLAREAVRKGLKITANQRVLLVTGNESADLDSFTSSLVFAYLTATHPTPAFQNRTYSHIIPIVNIPREEVSLRPELHYLLSTLSIPESDVICKDEFLSSLSSTEADCESVDVMLLDHNNLLSDLGAKFGKNVIGILDHHADEELHKDADPRVIEPVGSCTTLVIEYYKDFFSTETADREEAKSISDISGLALAPILVDTANLTSKAVKRDFEAVKLLSTAVLDGADPLESYYSALMSAKRSIDDFSLRDILRKDYKEWHEDNGRSVGISSSVRSLKWTVEKFGVKAFKAGIEKWAKEERKLDAYVFMDSFVDEKEGYRRDLLVTISSEKGDDCVRRFVKAAKVEFKLKEFTEEDCIADLKVDEKAGFWFYRQDNLKASRKQVAPLVRKYMQS
ncbi:uncharacterized protein V2V93DRAFT_389865 [Kockiozyma suomiensis]|uniref:uncharacterized protein n=1 Tax=Kockiozyma suomiensis TaxID=1337062 RepID=UPI00334438D1